MLLLRFPIFLLEIELYVDEVVVAIVVAFRDDNTICLSPSLKNNELSRQTNSWVSPFCLQRRA
jgi:hypothetical protein